MHSEITTQWDQMPRRGLAHHGHQLRRGSDAARLEPPVKPTERVFAAVGFKGTLRVSAVPRHASQEANPPAAVPGAVRPLRPGQTTLAVKLVLAHAQRREVR
jgi:hypothetical protein